jgi:hypothetical protein
MTEQTSQVAQMEKDQALLVYEQYSTWARHLHTMIWLASSFGVGICVGGLVLFKDLSPPHFAAAGVACVAILYYCHCIAEGSRRQWESHWRLLNALEAHWKLRDLNTNPSGPPLGLVEGQVMLGTRAARIGLMRACVIAWMFAAIVKFIS